MSDDTKQLSRMLLEAAIEAANREGSDCYFYWEEGASEIIVDGRIDFDEFARIMLSSGIFHLPLPSIKLAPRTEDNGPEWTGAEQQESEL